VVRGNTPEFSKAEGFNQWPRDAKLEFESVAGDL
jgi:hypothetical protein